MKKIGIFCGYYLPHLGGVERYVDKLSVSLKNLGYEIVIITFNHKKDLPNIESTELHTIYRLPALDVAKTRYPIPRYNKEYKELIQNIKDEQLDYYLLNTRFHLTSLIGSRLGVKAKAPILLIEHGTGHFTVGNTILDFFGKMYEHFLTIILKNRVDRFYGVSKNCVTWLTHFAINAAGVFYNAINPKDEKGVKDIYAAKYDSQEIVICYAGRLIKEKGVLNLLEAFVMVKKSFPTKKLRLVIAGSGTLTNYIQEAYYDPSIDVVGKLDFQHVMALYKRSDIFVHPSLYPEGLPTSILEAGLMDCALIATPRGGTEEVITDTDHGILVDGSVQSLHEAVSELVKWPSYRKKIAHNSKTRIKSIFAWDVVARSVDKELKSMLKNSESKT